VGAGGTEEWVKGLQIQEVVALRKPGNLDPKGLGKREIWGKEEERNGEPNLAWPLTPRSGRNRPRGVFEGWNIISQWAKPHRGGN